LFDVTTDNNGGVKPKLKKRNQKHQQYFVAVQLPGFEEEEGDIEKVKDHSNANLKRSKQAKRVEFNKKVMF
jgi:hypothetical protein